MFGVGWKSFVIRSSNGCLAVFPANLFGRPRMHTHESPQGIGIATAGVWMRVDQSVCWNETQPATTTGELERQLLTRFKIDECRLPRNHDVAVRRNQNLATHLCRRVGSRPIAFGFQSSSHFARSGIQSRAKHSGRLPRAVSFRRASIRDRDDKNAQRSARQHRFFRAGPSVSFDHRCLPSSIENICNDPCAWIAAKSSATKMMRTRAASTYGCVLVFHTTPPVSAFKQMRSC